LKVLKKYDVEVLRPDIIADYNQVFARDVAFVIDDKMIISNVIADRADEQEAYKTVLKKWRGEKYQSSGNSTLKVEMLLSGTIFCLSEHVSVKITEVIKRQEPMNMPSKF
jgi:N-dimethylarginine dimethylaminohydrolase